MASYEGQRFNRKGTFKPYQGFRTPLPETPPSEKPLKSLFGSKRKTERESGKEKKDPDAAHRDGDRSERFDPQDSQTPTKSFNRTPANANHLAPKSSAVQSPGPQHRFAHSAGRNDVSMSSDNMSFSLSASHRKFSGDMSQSARWSPLVKGVQSQADLEPDSLAIAMHKLYRFQAENELLRKEVKQWRQAAEGAREDNKQLEGIQTLLRNELDVKDRKEAELQALVADLRSQLRILQAETDAQNARLGSLADDNKRLQAGAEEVAKPMVDHMEHVVAKLREDCNAKVEELLGAEKVMMEQQLELRHKAEELQQQSAEIAALNKTIQSLQDYVVKQG
mmetsp:Transcript_59112/g.139232  ORF Transcript_59112/g.139232 Transcript_59112/m.139232 type:complete len:336 (-) Transcript_59112:81-1088(-)